MVLQGYFVHPLYLFNKYYFLEFCGHRFSLQLKSSLFDFARKYKLSSVSINSLYYSVGRSASTCWTPSIEISCALGGRHLKHH